MVNSTHTLGLLIISGFFKQENCENSISSQAGEGKENFPQGDTACENCNSDFGETYKFTSKELDPETGLYYHGARYRDPRLNNWLSPDPILNSYLDGKRGHGGVYNPVNLNLYHYAFNNPIKYLDPDGNAGASGGWDESSKSSVTFRGKGATGSWDNASLKDEVSSTFKTYGSGDKKYSTATMDGKTLIFGGGVTKESIDKSKSEVFGAINDMMIDNKYSSATISSLFREGADDSHGQGLGVDLTEIVKNGNTINLQDIGKIRRSEPDEARNLTDWLINKSGGRVDKNQVLTPWRQNGNSWANPSDWRASGASKDQKDHRHHFHFKIFRRDD